MFYQLIAKPLEFYYQLIPNYAIAIALLTTTIMVILLPLTLKGTRSMLAMQRLQPELKKIQNKHRDDRQKLNEEVMKFYKENNINPMSGCLPLLLQMPVFIILYRTLYELLNRAPYGEDMGRAVSRSITGVNGGVWQDFGFFHPKHLDMTSKLYQDLSHSSTMESFGINLAQSAQKSFAEGVTHAAPYIIMILAVTGTSYYQQRQIAGRNPQAAMANPQQAMLMKIMPLFMLVFAFALPAALVVYLLVSNLFRIGQQAFITRTMYSDPTLVDTSAREVDKSSTESPKGFLAQLKEIGLPNPSQAREDVRTNKGTDTGSKGSGSAKAKTAGSNGKAKPAASKPAGSKSPASKPAGSKTPAADGGASKPAATTTDKGSNGAASRPSRAAPQAGNRSKDKKKRK